MASVDLWRYKRIVQAFWDPEPENDDTSGSCIWCLGKEYEPRPPLNGLRDSTHPSDEETSALGDGGDSCQNKQTTDSLSVKDLSKSEKDQLETESTKGWPPRFLDDCESRIWFTYRSNFPAIKKSSDASMTLSVRLRNLGDQGGFTSDTGWGCMIRSGQSLLANALVLLRMGRGKLTLFRWTIPTLTLEKVGAEEVAEQKSDNSYHCLRITPTRHLPSIAL